MHIETSNNVPLTDHKSYLRTVALSSKANLGFFYIGNDQNSIHFLEENFRTGFSATNLEAAKKIIDSRAAGIVDVFIIDIPYNLAQLEGFYYFLKNRNLEDIPLIYNEHHLKNVTSPLADYIVDDVIDLNNWQFDLYNKVNFLKKSKNYLLTGHKKRTVIDPRRSITKRLLDIIVASFLLVLLLPLFIVIAILIKLESKGPIFYNAKRAGRGFRIFKFYKFRTMEVNADKKIQTLAHLNQYNPDDKGAKFFKISNDPRITKVGKFLRNTSLDELPQLLNVIKGDMSLVGNRPLPLYEAASLTTNDFVERFMAPAGMTGLWQIKKRGKTEMSVDERIKLDISYAKNATLLYDFWIMAKTPAAIFQKSDV